MTAFYSQLFNFHLRQLIISPCNKYLVLTTNRMYKGSLIIKHCKGLSVFLKANSVVYMLCMFICSVVCVICFSFNLLHIVAPKIIASQLYEIIWKIYVYSHNHSLTLLPNSNSKCFSRAYVCVALRHER